MATMNISLPDDLVEFVRSELGEGGYGNQSDVVRDGLRLLREQKRKRRILQSLLAEGRLAVEGGKTVPFTDALLDSIVTDSHKAKQSNQPTRRKKS
jgi:putative addiction module CopG family antidote